MLSTSLNLNLKPAAEILCLYVNATSQIQIARLADVKDCSFERVVFPGQRFFFEAVPDAELEINTSVNGYEVLAEKISCESLQVD